MSIQTLVYPTDNDRSGFSNALMRKHLNLLPFFLFKGDTCDTCKILHLKFFQFSEMVCSGASVQIYGEWKQQHKIQIAIATAACDR